MPAKKHDLTNEGTVTFWAQSNRPGGRTDPMPPNFPPFSSGGITVKSAKNPDLTLSAEIVGPHGRSYSFNSVAIPRCDDKGLHVGITWNMKTVRLYLNGKEAQSIDVVVH